jgi:hypothetical protein
MRDPQVRVVERGSVPIGSLNLARCTPLWKEDPKLTMLDFQQSWICLGVCHPHNCFTRVDAEFFKYVGLCRLNRIGHWRERLCT